jgi:5-methyltetrahydrofolate--homocysteine methyltransferase
MISLRKYLENNIVIADGAMGTMLQAQDPSMADFQNHEGCNEILNITRPDIVASVHKAYLEAGVDAIETNTFGANLANLGEYGIEDRIYELALAGAKIARKSADSFASKDSPKFVLGSMGPGTKLPTLGHTTYEILKDAYEVCAQGLIDGGSDALLIETTQDLLQAKAAVNGARAAIEKSKKDILLIAQVTVETNGTMLLGSEIGAALNALEPLSIDLIGLNCATGPQEMSEHLRTLSLNTNIGISVMPNAGLPILGENGAHYPLSPEELANSLLGFVKDYKVNLVGGCCGTTPEHLAVVVAKIKSQEAHKRFAKIESGASSLYQYVPFRQDKTYLAIGEKTNANGSKAFRDALLADDWQSCVEIARDQIRDGAHMLDLSVDYVGRDGVADMSKLAHLFSTASTLPIVLDSTEPLVLEAGLKQLGGRSVINSVNFEDGEGSNSRFSKIMPLVKEHGAAVIALTIDEDGQARDKEWKLRVATRLIEKLTGEWSMNQGDIIIDMLTFPIATGQEETRRDGIETLSAIAELKKKYPDVQTTLGVSNISFGLNPAARIVLNSVFLAEAVNNGLDSAIVHPSKIMPMHKISDEQKNVALDLIYDRREYDQQGELTYDPLNKLLEIFSGVEVTSSKESRAADLAALSLTDRLQRRIIDGEKVGLEDDLKQALAEKYTALQIINDYLLAGMKTVGELFGKGEMQLPFVLQSAEVMKSAVALLEPFIEKTDDAGRGKILLATVKGDVHDIGKNLVDIILSNNGYDTVNIGIKQTVNQIIEAAESNNVDVIGMSGLLVKSTVIMKENLEEITSRGLEKRWPIVLGGAALTRSFVEQDLAEKFGGTVRYAKDAFEGLRLMDTFMAIKKGVAGAELPPLKKRVTSARNSNFDSPIDTRRSDVSESNPVPIPPFFGSKVVKGVALNDYSQMLDERALFLGQWGLKGKDFESMANEEGRPRLRSLLNEVQSKGWLNAAVTYGNFPCYSEGNDLVVLHHEGELKGQERVRFNFPRQSRDRRLCLSDFFRSKESGELDVVSFQIITMGQSISDAITKLFNANLYREYLELHGLSVQLTEALTEMWHARTRDELGFSKEDNSDLKEIFNQGYRGSRYSFGYPACPDLSQQVQLLELLEPEKIGVTLSEEHQLHPEQSTTSIVLHHPEAKYFNAS